jgi:TFIIF-interacting CTD phosphatase-like protein
MSTPRHLYSHQPSRLNVLLDLDQTLISAEDWNEHDFDSNKKKAKKFKFHDMDGYYIVFERPNLQQFLDYLFDNFNVSVWTAASKDYALFIIDKIILTKPDRHLDWVFFSYHCDISKSKKDGSKDLSMLWNEYKIDGYNEDNTIIIDDYKEVYDTQPDNCVKAFPFEFTDKGSENDQYLENLQRALFTISKGRPAVSVNKSLRLGDSDNTKMK